MPALAEAISDANLHSYRFAPGISDEAVKAEGRSIPETYLIETPIDFLKVPLERLPACLREFRAFLAAYHAIMMATDGAAKPSGTSFTWIDDGLEEMHVKLHSDGDLLSEFTLPVHGAAS